MKKILSVVVFILCTLLSGCGNIYLPENKGLDTDKITTDESIVVGFSQLGAESDWRSANTQSMKSTFTEENGYKLILRTASKSRQTRLWQSVHLSSRKLIILFLRL